MCCFAQAVLNVKQTRIFARLSGTGTQLLAYQMEYESEKPNAMILPLPVKLPAREDSVRFVDLSQYEEFFEDLSSAFPYQRSRNIGCSSAGFDELAAGSVLMVHKVGSFIASFVPTIDDFDRLDKQFVIPKETWQQIPEYENYGFAVFQLNELSGKPHPMAFEFESRSDRVFFPTVHISRWPSAYPRTFRSHAVPAARGVRQHCRRLHQPRRARSCNRSGPFQGRCPVVLRHRSCKGAAGPRFIDSSSGPDRQPGKQRRGVSNQRQSEHSQI